VEGLGAEVFVSALLKYGSDAVAVSDRQSGRFVVVSDSLCALAGYARDELVGRTSVDVGMVAGHAVRSEVLDRADQEGGAVYELPIRRKDGAIRLFEFSMQLLPRGLMLTISRDVTERRRAEEDQIRLAAIVQSSEDAILGCTLDHVITSWNPGAERLYGCGL
jgi:PAS domain S-box-containing protein